MSDSCFDYKDFNRFRALDTGILHFANAKEERFNRTKKRKEESKGIIDNPTLQAEYERFTADVKAGKIKLEDPAFYDKLTEDLKANKIRASDASKGPIMIKT